MREDGRLVRLLRFNQAYFDGIDTMENTKTDGIGSGLVVVAYIDTALSLPDLASPVLNRIKAEAYREAAEIVGPEDSYQDDWFKAKADSCAKLRAKADELEKEEKPCS